MNLEEYVNGSARAAYESAVESWLTAIDALRIDLTNQPALQAELEDGNSPLEKRQQKLISILPADTSQEIKNYFMLLLQEGHLGLLSEISAQIKHILAQGASLVNAMVTSAIPLTEEEAAQFRQKLQQKYGANMDIQFKVDSDIIGGVIVQIGDKIIDSSVAGRLESLREKLIKA